MNTRRAGQVLRDYQTEFPDPLSVEAGERLEVSEKVDNWRGNPGWIPEDHVS